MRALWHSGMLSSIILPRDLRVSKNVLHMFDNLRADATAADTRGYMGSRYELRWSVLGARDLKKSLKNIENH